MNSYLGLKGLGDGRERGGQQGASERNVRAGVWSRGRGRERSGRTQGGCQRRIDRHGLYAGGCVSVGALEFVTTERVCATVSGMATMNIVNLGKLLTDYKAFMALDSLGRVVTRQGADNIATGKLL